MNVSIDVNFVRKEIYSTDQHDNPASSVGSNVKKINFNTAQTSMKSYIHSKYNHISIVSQGKYVLE